MVTPLPDGPPLRLGIAKHTDIETIKKQNASFIDYLSNAIERDVKLEIVENFTDISKRMDDGTIDLAALPSYQYVQATKRRAPITLIATPKTRTGTGYEGYILVNAGSKINSIEGLKK